MTGNCMADCTAVGLCLHAPHKTANPITNDIINVFFTIYHGFLLHIWKPDGLLKESFQLLIFNFQLSHRFFHNPLAFGFGGANDLAQGEIFGIHFVDAKSLHLLDVLDGAGFQEL